MLTKISEMKSARAIQCGNSSCIAPNSGSPEMMKFWHVCDGFRFYSNFGWPKFGAIHVRLSHYIAFTAYSWLTLVINCDKEVCSHSYNAVSRAFWKKKVRSLQRISCCGVISKPLKSIHRTTVSPCPMQPTHELIAERQFICQSQGKYPTAAKIKNVPENSIKF